MGGASRYFSKVLGSGVDWTLLSNVKQKFCVRGCHCQPARINLVLPFLVLLYFLGHFSSAFSKLWWFLLLPPPLPLTPLFPLELHKKQTPTPLHLPLPKPPNRNTQANALATPAQTAP